MSGKRKDKWVKGRHRFFYKMAKIVLAPIIKFKYHFKIRKFNDSKGQYFVVHNHQTPFDQFFVSMLFSGKLYHVASEDLFSNGFVSKLIKYAVAPIPFKKGTADFSSIMTCKRIVKEGGTIILCPEGNRTYSGQTCYIKPSVAKLVKALKIPLAIVKLQGGYGIEPRWSDVVRKGKGEAFVEKVVSPEEYDKMTDDQLYQLILNTLSVDESLDTGIFKSRKRAEYLERAYFVCPDCGLSIFESKGNIVKCTKCGKQIIYNQNKSLTGIGFNFKFKTTAEWYNWQREYILSRELTDYTDGIIYADKIIFKEVIINKNKKKIYKSADFALYKNKLTASGKKGEMQLDFCDISAIACLGRNKLNIYYKDKVYQVKGKKKGFCALKYMFIYYGIKNITEGNDGTFLGI